MATDTISCTSQFPPPIGSSSPNQFSISPVVTGGTPVSYLWSNGSTNKTLFPDSPGTYTVTVTESGGCTATASVIVRKYGDPGSTETPALTVSKLCFGSPTQLTGHGSSIDKFNMTFGDGEVSGAVDTPTVLHTYSSSGPFNAWVTITNRCGVNTTVGTTVNLSMPPSPTIPSTIPICNSPATLDANANNLPNLTYAWSNGSSNKTISVADPGGISVAVTDGITGCTGTASTLAFDGRPLVDLGPDLVICQPDNGHILDAHNTGSTFVWTINGTNASTNQTIQVSTATTGVFDYVVTITNPLTTCISSDAVKVTVNPAAASPTATLSDGRVASGASLSLCQSANVVVTATHPSPATFAWSLNGGAIERGPSVSVPTSDVINLDYQLTATVTATGCNAVSQFSIAIKSTPDRPTITAVNATTLESSATTGNQWYKEGAILAGQVARQLTVTQAGNYTVRTTVNSCTSSTSDIFPFGITGVDKEEDKLLLFPNPATELLYVKFGKSRETAEIFVIDMTGRTHLQHVVQSNAPLSIADLAPGLYTLMAIVDGRTHLQRFVKY